MHFSTLLLCLVGAVQPSMAGYVLEDDYTPSNWYSMFDFFTSSDPTHGFVQYVDQATAQSEGLISTTSDSVYMGVDHTNVASGGRSSVRLTSNKAYNHGLVILDLAHMPQGCGTWPAFWMVGPDWPYNGEIDIIEGVNMQTSNAMTLHTGDGCSISRGDFTGSLSTANCNIDAPGQAQNQGCGISAGSSNTYGSGFNSNNGGVYATEWTSSAISIYFFPRGGIPADITSGSPNPSSWGTPLAQFSGGCDIDNFFKNQQIVFDITFCGDWAGNVWSTSSCASMASTCDAFVQNNPSAFSETYWTVNSLKVYQDNGAPVQPSPSSTYQPTPAPISSAAPAPVGTTLGIGMSIENPFPVSTQNIQTTFMVSTKAGSSNAYLSEVTGLPGPSGANPFSASGAPLSAVTGLPNPAPIQEISPEASLAAISTSQPQQTSAPAPQPVSQTIAVESSSAAAVPGPYASWKPGDPMPSAWFPSNENASKEGCPESLEPKFENPTRLRARHVDIHRRKSHAHH